MKTLFTGYDENGNITEIRECDFYLDSFGLAHMENSMLGYNTEGRVAGDNRQCVRVTITHPNK